MINVYSTTTTTTTVYPMIIYVKEHIHVIRNTSKKYCSTVTLNQDLCYCYGERRVCGPESRLLFILDLPVVEQSRPATGVGLCQDGVELSGGQVHTQRQTVWSVLGYCHRELCYRAQAEGDEGLF